MEKLQMTLNEIFTEVQYGKEYAKQKALKENISKYYDEDLSLFYASKRIKDMANEAVMSESEEKKVNRITSKLMVLEDRLETGKLMSDAYRKMQTAAVIDDCKALMEEATASRKVDTRKLEIFAKIIGDAKYFVENNLDDKVVLKESSNVLFNKLIKEEHDNLVNVL